MSMQIVCTKSNLIGSKIIRWGLGEPVSHFAINFDNKIVFHSSFSGVHLTSYPTFIKKHTVVFSLNMSLSEVEEESVYQSIIPSEEDGYDVRAFICLALLAAKRKFFGIPFPTVNPDDNKNKFLCTELGEFLPEKLFVNGKPSDFSTTTPYQLFKMLGGQQ